MIREKVDRLRELYKTGGVGRVAVGVRDFIYYSLTPSQTYQERRADIDDRWEFIRPHIESSETFLDIGCAEGYYTKRAAESGLFAIGVDIRAERLENARENYGFPDRCGFAKWDLSPDSIHQLPRVDVINLLTVHHHWEEHFGLDEAERMFQTVMDRCDILIYEPPGDRPIVRSLDGTLDPSQSIEFYTARLAALYGDAVDIVDVTMTEFRVDEERYRHREDPIFVLDTSRFSSADESATSAADGPLQQASEV